MKKSDIFTERHEGITEFHEAFLRNTCPEI